MNAQGDITKELRYLGDGQEQADAFILGVEQVPRRADVRRVVMGFSEIFRHEGERIGLQKGKLEKALEIARGMLNEGTLSATIARVTCLSRHQLTALRKKK
ncbi:MAG: hypothetical protein AAF471_01365 [Myxococcota bacterium]